MAHSELIDYFDDAGNMLGSCERAEAEDQNLTTANAIVFVLTSTGDIWLQHRAETKKHYPGCWDTTACGGMVHGESALEAAERELFEESGFTCHLQHVETFLNTFPDESGKLTRKRLSHLFVGVSDEQPRGNHEVQGFQKFNHSEILDQARQHPEKFVPSMALEIGKAILGFKQLA